MSFCFRGVIAQHKAKEIVSIRHQQLGNAITDSSFRQSQTKANAAVLSCPRPLLYYVGGDGCDSHRLTDNSSYFQTEEIRGINLVEGEKTFPFHTSSVNSAACFC